MKTWFTSLNGAIALSVIALLTFMGGTFLDYQFVFDEYFPGPGQAGMTTLINMALFGGWIWALLAASRGARGGLIATLIFTLLFFLGIAVGTLVAYCPSPCSTAWPVIEIANWAKLITGLMAAVAVGLQLRPAAGVTHPD
jgi:hypothetical protein